jgi:hypothetical protein
MMPTRTSKHGSCERGSDLCPIPSGVFSLALGVLLGVQDSLSVLCKEVASLRSVRAFLLQPYMIPSSLAFIAL